MRVVHNATHREVCVPDEEPRIAGDDASGMRLGRTVAAV